ncbi:MAG: CCA tRNA nucleotidyltransferase [Rhodobacteraceae bacterium]|nr:CCA tRNA nucleotidyltransferase [Paracoccaceae bacterium]
MTRVGGDWLDRPATQAVCTALTGSGARALFVGGCVRNALIGAPVRDIDIATDATPDTVMRIAADAGLRPVATGADHGTVTVVSDGVPHEVTTFRRDVRTDGRHAVVAFSRDMAEDAARRDFTMNALYATPDGDVLDPLGGLADLAARRVRFIGDANARIREDYLRSLRFFRFHAWYGNAAAGMDAEALAAIAGQLDGLDQLSRERVGAELLRLLAAPDPAPAVAAMRQTGVLMQVLPGVDDRALAPLIDIEARYGMNPDPLRRLAALGDAGAGLRLARAQVRHLELLRRLVQSTQPAPELGFRHGAQTAHDVLALRAALLEQPPDPAALAQASEAAGKVFPVSAPDLMPRWQGPALGARLEHLRSLWIASGFVLSRGDLLNAPD